MTLKFLSKRASLALSTAGTGIVMILACSGQRGATEQQIAAAQQKMPSAAQLYEQSCTECHGKRGEGGPGTPPIMGPGALPVKLKEKRSMGATGAASSDPTMRERQQQEARGGPKELRMRFNTAADIFQFIQEEHPSLSSPLTDEELYAVLSFVLDAHGLPIPQGGVTAQNAASVKNTE
jgi:mono/diheme cytochrome c family protein